MASRVVLLGAPGAGKGTQAYELARYLDAPHISTGDIFRENLRNKTELGQRAEAYMNSGQLVPDSLVVEIVRDRLAQPDCRNGYVLDGFPRSVGQAEALDAFLEERGEQLDYVIQLEVDEEEIIGRLTARRSCVDCGAIFNLRTDSPDKRGCPEGREVSTCNIVQRSDDTEETVRERIRVYQESTQPLLDYYARTGALSVVESSGEGPAEVFERVKTIVGADGAKKAP